jgi:peptidoglycan/LPS O-acetylase OafA/YrhL
MPDLVSERASARVASAANFATIQALRAIAALLVVVYHAFDIWAFRINTSSPGLLWKNGAAGVDIFFIISGFVMVVSSQRLMARPDAWRVFIWHRIVRIVPLYWLLTTLKCVLVFVFADLVVRSSLDADYVVRSYLLLPVVDSAKHFRPVLPVGWTLTYEFLFYLFFALARAARLDVLKIVVPAFAVLVILALLRTKYWPQWTILFNTIVVEFAFGIMLGKLTLRGWALSPVWAVGLLVAGFLAILAIPEVSELARPLTWGLPAFAIVTAAVALEGRGARLLPQWLLTLGDASYSIYLTHGFVLPVVGLGIVALHATGPTGKAATVMTSLAVASVAGWIAYLVVERPLTVWLKQRIAA